MVAGGPSASGGTARGLARIALLTLLAVVGGAVIATRLGEPQAHAARDADDGDDARPKTAPIADSHAPQAGLVKLDADGIEKGGIETAPPPRQPFQESVRVYGSVIALDRLTSLYNSVILETVAAKSAQVKLEAAKVVNARAQAMLKSFPTAKAQAESAEAAQSLEAAGAEAAAAQLEALRNTAIQDWGPVLGAAIVVRARLASDLMQRRTCLILLAWAPDKIASAPRRVTIATPSGGVTADFVSPAAQLDPRIQGAAYYYVAPAAPDLLPGASVEAGVPKGETAQGLGIPASAVVWQGGKAWVYLRDGAGTFRRRPLGGEATPTPDGGYVVPAASLPHDPALVVSGAQILLSQETRSTIPSDEDDQ